jgi:hypothetical protein
MVCARAILITAGSEERNRRRRYRSGHTGAFGTVSIRLTASKIGACANDKRAYTTLRYVFIGSSPWAGVPADMKTSNYIAGAGRPLPPADQTVELGCG